MARNAKLLSDLLTESFKLYYGLKSRRFEKELERLFQRREGDILDIVIALCQQRTEVV